MLSARAPAWSSLTAANAATRGGVAPVSTAQTARASAKCRAIRVTSTSTEVDHHVLDLGVVRQCFDALLASESAALVAAKGQPDAALDAVARSEERRVG